MTRDTFRPMRVGNIEMALRQDTISGDALYEILAYYPNPYYGREKEYVKDGEWFHPKDSPHSSIHKDCFKNRQSCYVIAWIRWNRAGDEFDIHSVGTRAFDLDEEDERSLKKILAEMNRNEEDE